MANPTDLLQAKSDDAPVTRQAIRRPTMKRPASTRSLLTVPFAIPAYWTPDQALAVVQLLDGLRELIWARYGLQLLDERRAKLQPFADSLFTPRRSKKTIHQQNGWLTSGQRQTADVGDDDLPF
jgi:hypothetical protein